MAIETVNARYEGFIFDGQNSRNYGVYVTDVEVFGAPVRNVEMIQIPGRNGAYALDNGFYENIQVTYKCAMGCESQADFNAGISAFRNMLASRIGYKRLEDEINTDEYRMACFHGGISVPTLNKETATFDVVFDCKPQRFLKSGETAVTIGGSVTNTQTKSGSIVSIESDGGDAVTSLVAQITPIQAGSGDPSPINVRPFTGWTAANVFVISKNLFDKDATDTGNGYHAGRWIRGTTGQESNDSNYSISEYIPIKANTQYTVSGTYGNNPGVCFYDENKQFVSGIGYRTAIANPVCTFTTPSGVMYARFSIVNAMVDEMQLEVGGEKTDYVPYTRHTTTAALGQTVYGGTRDVVTGVLTVTHKFLHLTSVTQISTPTGGHVYWRFVLNDKGINGALPETIICNMAKGAYGEADNTCYITSAGGLFLIFPEDQTLNTKALVDAWLASHTLQICYKLATPQTYQLTPQEVELLAGNNNVWADTGDITLTYGRDPNKIVNPTLFDASPLLKVYGYGDIVLGDGGTVSVSEDVTVGNTVLANGGQVGLTYTESIVMGSDKFMTGDVITLASTSININLNTNESITSATASVSSGYSVNTSVTKLNNRTLLATVLWDEETLTVGTSRDLSTIVNVSIVTSGGNVVVQIPATISYNASTRTITRTLQTPTAISGTVSRIGGYSILGSITGYSTAPAYTEPLYFDLDIGEAYAIEDGVPVSINNAVSFGTVLPVLKPGANTITRSVTITDLKIIPRWWKV